jgi:plastocyanin domain-containing protein
MKKIIGLGLIGLGIYWILKCQKHETKSFSSNPNDPQSQPYSAMISM